MSGTSCYLIVFFSNDNWEPVIRMMVLIFSKIMFLNMFLACHSMDVPWAMVIKPLNNTEKQPKLKYLRPEDNRTHWSADGEPAIQRLLNEDGSDVHHDPAKVPSKDIVLQTIGLLKKTKKTSPGHSLIIGSPQKPPILPPLEM